MSFYRRYIVPPLINCACGAKPIRYQRRKIVPEAEGVVLELGFGSGLNLAYYDAAKVSKIYALEPEEGMLVRARKIAANAALPVEVLAEKAEDLSLPAASVDTVLVTYSLCTIPDGAAALEGAKRALKPGGKLLFCEHGLAPDEKVARGQASMERWWKHISGGCHLTRDIPAMIRGAGFTIDRLETMYLPSTPKPLGYNFWGAARAA
ncbi:MAG: class I SAM-dependent methyltransferase [Hyphomonadaceae bacterium]